MERQVDRFVDRLEGYALGAFGLILIGVSLATQIVAIANGQLWMAVVFTLGILGGGLLYRAGFRLASR